MERTGSMMVAAATVAAVVGVGCASPEEQCNDARVVAHDAWVEVQQALDGECGRFKNDFWQKVRAQTFKAFDNAMRGYGVSDFQDAAGKIEHRTEEYKKTFGSACSGIRRATAVSTEGAVQARDASQAARSNLEKALKMGPSVEAKLSKLKQPAAKEAASRFKAHLEAVQNADLENLLADATDASEDAWEECRSVDP